MNGGSLRSSDRPVYEKGGEKDGEEELSEAGMQALVGGEWDWLQTWWGREVRGEEEERRL